MYFNSVNVVQEEQAVAWFNLKKYPQISTISLISITPTIRQYFELRVGEYIVWMQVK